MNNIEETETDAAETETEIEPEGAVEEEDTGDDDSEESEDDDSDDEDGDEATAAKPPSTYQCFALAKAWNFSGFHNVVGKSWKENPKEDGMAAATRAAAILTSRGATYDTVSAAIAHLGKDKGPDRLTVARQLMLGKLTVEDAPAPVAKAKAKAKAKARKTAKAGKASSVQSAGTDVQALMGLLGQLLALPVVQQDALIAGVKAARAV